MNNIKLFISTTGTLDPVIISDFGNRTFIHPTTDYEITLEYTFEELFCFRRNQCFTCLQKHPALIAPWHKGLPSASLLG